MFVPIAIALCTNRPTICVCVWVTIKRFILFCLKILSIINYGQCWTISFPNRFLPLFLHFNSTTFHSETKGGLVSTVLHYQLSPTQTIVNWSSIIYTHMVWCGHNSPLDLVWLVHDKSNLNSFKSGTCLSQPGWTVPPNWYHNWYSSINTWGHVHFGMLCAIRLRIDISWHQMYNQMSAVISATYQ